MPAPKTVDARAKWIASLRHSALAIGSKHHMKMPSHRARIAAQFRGQKSPEHLAQVTRNLRPGHNKGQRGMQVAWNKGIPMPAETRAKLSAALKGRDILGPANRAKACKREGTSIERAIAQVLDALGIQYEAQYQIGRYCVDFYIRSHNQIIECDGEYWHSRPGAKEHDQCRDAELVEMGYNVVRLTGRAIQKNAQAALEAAWRLS